VLLLRSNLTQNLALTGISRYVDDDDDDDDDDEYIIIIVYFAFSSIRNIQGTRYTDRHLYTTIHLNSKIKRTNKMVHEEILNIDRTDRIISVSTDI